MSIDGLVKTVWGSLSLVEKGMIVFTLMVYVVSAVNPTTRERALRSVETGGRSLVRISLLLLSGVFLGSFVGTFLPRQLVSSLLGQESGFTGIILGSLFGAAMPGGPYVIFPIVAALFSSGAAVPSLIAMIFAWQCISLTRIPTDLGYLAVVEGQRLIWLRVLIGVPIPILAGIVAGIIWRAG
ncbi:MAG: permease [Candidatus Bathyarchaeota archaeon]|nr:MAG: permease [Candidatus Bathyarchaeota archaeon]